MIFNFLTYIKPVWYFNRNQQNGKTIFSNPKAIPKEIENYIIWDNNYKSNEASLRDASWQVFQKGYIGNTETLRFEGKFPIVDEYRFVRKYQKSFLGKLLFAVAITYLK